jgi:hypothetical protein
VLILDQECIAWEVADAALEKTPDVGRDQEIGHAAVERHRFHVLSGEGEDLILDMAAYEIDHLRHPG